MFANSDITGVILSCADASSILSIYNTSKCLRNALNGTNVLEAFSYGPTQFPECRSAEDLLYSSLIAVGIDASPKDIDVVDGASGMKLEVGSRVNNASNNYIVIHRDGGTVSLRKIDAYGFGLSNKKYTASIHLLDNSYQWIMMKERTIKSNPIRHTKVTTIMLNSQLFPGTLLFKDGPLIKSMASLFLRFKTLPSKYRSVAIPETGMFAKVLYFLHLTLKETTHIITCYNHQMSLLFLRPTDSHTFTLPLVSYIVPSADDLVVRRAKDGNTWETCANPLNEQTKHHSCIAGIKIHMGRW